MPPDLAPEQLAHARYTTTSADALADTDALVIVMEWKTFRSPDFKQIKQCLKQQLTFEGRKLFEPDTMLDNDLEYHGIGRSRLTRA